MSHVHKVNANADVISSKYALNVNVTAAKGLMNVLKSNLGPTGTIKMLVSGAGAISLTKDGCVLLKQMQIQHPTASLIARTAAAQDQETGDGTTSSVLFTGELLKQAERYVQEGLHPRVILEGVEVARTESLKFLDEFKVGVEQKDEEESLDRELLINVAQTSLRTKLTPVMADVLTEIVVDAVLCVQKPGQPVDLHMVEIIEMRHKKDTDTRLVKGLVLDHGARHPNMKKRAENCFILTCNIPLEWEKTEVNSGFFYSSAEQREALVKGERKNVNDKCKQIIDFKKQVCGNDESKNFVLINQNGIDPICLDMLQRAGIIGIRRAKRRNMERLTLACGGYAINSVEGLKEDCLGYAGLVYEHVLGDDKFTFVENVPNKHSCTILINGPNRSAIKQTKDAIRDGLRSVNNVIKDGALVPGAGAFEIALYRKLTQLQEEITGRSKLGVQAFADAVLIIPKTLARNSGLDAQETVISLVDAARQSEVPVGLNLETGDPLNPVDEGIWDNYCVKQQIIHLGALISSKLLLVDEIMRAGRVMNKT